MAVVINILSPHPAVTPERACRIPEVPLPKQNPLSFPGPCPRQSLWIALSSVAGMTPVEVSVKYSVTSGLE